MYVHSLHIYPVKSLAGHSVTSAETARRGFVDDRRWMLIDETRRFISQRTQPGLCRWQATVKGDDLELRQLDTGKVLIIPNAKDEEGEWINVQVWHDTFKARLVRGAEPQLLTGCFGFDCRLVYLATDSYRPLDENYAKAGEEVSFADGFPYLIANTASLDDLSERYGHSLSTERFRPNIVVAGHQAFAEDQWQQLKIGESLFRLPKACSRCTMVTIDPQKNTNDPEVFATLANYRKQDRKVLFGMNACWEGQGTAVLRVGDKVVVCCWRACF